jgi:hypothetical protein
MKRAVFGLLVIAAAALVPGCSARIEGPLSRDGSAQLTLDASLGPQITALIRRFQAMGNPSANQAGNILDGAAITQSLTASPGITSALLNNKGPAAIAGTINVVRIGALLDQSGGAGANAFISYDPGGLLRATLDRNSLPRLMSLFSPDILDYLSMLMAPIATGETLSMGEYLSLLGRMYGDAMRNEIAAARIDVIIDFPGPITAIQGGAAQERRALFSVLLVEALVLERPLHYEVRWSPDR